MYETLHQKSAFTPPSSGSSCVSDEVLPARRRLQDVEPHTPPPQLVRYQRRRQHCANDPTLEQSAPEKN